MREEWLDTRCLYISAIGICFTKVIGSLSCCCDVIAISKAVNSVLDVIERRIESLR